MATPEAEEAAARVIERLLVDPGFRADFRRDPATACRQAGLDDLAEEMSYGAGKAMYTLDIRESRSSLAGVMMAAAFEGLAVFELSEHIVPGIVGAPASVQNVLSRVNLPKIDAPDVDLPSVDVRGKLAQGGGQAPPAAASAPGAPAAPPGSPAAPGAVGGAPSAAPAAPAVAPPGAAGGEPAGGSFEPTDASASNGPSNDSPGGPPAGEQAPPKSGFSAADGDDPGASAPPKSGFSAGGDDPGASAPPKSGFSAAGDDATPAGDTAPKSGFSVAGDDTASPAGDAAPRSSFEAIPQPQPSAATAAPVPQASAPATPEPQAPRAPIDSGEFGADGSGGQPEAEALALLQNKNVVLDENGVADIKAGRIDPRVVAVLTKLSEEHKITVSCMCTDHPSFASPGSTSNHRQGRGVDIARVDGQIVNAGSPLAREIAMKLPTLDEKIRPNEIGTPWAIAGPGFFTDANHQDHLHIGFKQAIDPSWKPPSEVAVGGSASTAPAAAAPAPAAAAPAAPAGRDTISFAAVRTGEPATSHESMTFAAVAPTAGAADAAAPSPAAPASGAAPGAPDAVPAAPEAAAAPPAAVDPALGSAIGEAAAERLAREGVTQPAGTKALAALAETLRHKGTPYLWGGSKPETGFDCSGLTQWAYAQQGIQTGRTTYDQIDAPSGSKVDRKDLVPGDLVFFKSASGDVHHMGISMGGDRFLHAPHTGDVVKISSLEEPYYAGQFAGGRRFDEAPAGSAPAPAGSAPTPAGSAPVPAASAPASPAPAAVEAAKAAVERDAVAATQRNSMVFKALTKQEASNFNSTVQFMQAVKPPEAAAPAAGPPASALAAADAGAAASPVGGSLEYPGNDASKEQLARWLGAHAEKAGLPPELPVMAALTESGIFNNPGGDADSVGYFQMRASIWNKGEYLGYYENPNLQAKWFIDHALALKAQRGAGFGQDPSGWGEWIADVERPAAQYRGRYQTQLATAQRLLGR